jgi:hypothetical protein
MVSAMEEEIWHFQTSHGHEIKSVLAQNKKESSRSLVQHLQNSRMVENEAWGETHALAESGPKTKLVE